MTPCDRYEGSILMLLHKQLGFFKALPVRLHLITCPACRAQFATYHRLSSRLALGLRRENSTRPVGAFIPQAALGFVRGKLFLLLLLGAVAGGGYFVALQATGSPMPWAAGKAKSPSTATAPASTASPDGKCIPGKGAKPRAL